MGNWQTPMPAPDRVSMTKFRQFQTVACMLQLTV